MEERLTFKLSFLINFLIEKKNLEKNDKWDFFYKYFLYITAPDKNVFLESAFVYISNFGMLDGLPMQDFLEKYIVAIFSYCNSPYKTIEKR